MEETIWTMELIEQEYAKIRKRYPRKPMGDHWESVGVYVGEDVWADPAFMGQPGVAEDMIRPRKKRKNTS